MQTDTKLRAVIEKYRTHPQLLGLSLPADPNCRGAMGDTLLHLAVEAGNAADVEVLVAAGADINARGDIGNTPLHTAALLGRIEAAMTLIAHGANRAMKNEFGETPLDVAITGRHAEIASLLKQSQR